MGSAINYRWLYCNFIIDDITKSEGPAKFNPAWHKYLPDNSLQCDNI